jgi:hypothetical protein
MNLAHLFSDIVQKALLAQTSQSLAQTLIVSAHPELERSPDYQARKGALKRYFDQKLYDALNKLIRSDFNKTDLLERIIVLESYTPAVVNSLWPLLLWYRCQADRDDYWLVWLQLLETAIIRNDIPCLKLLAMDTLPQYWLSKDMSEVLLDKADSKQPVLEWLLEHYGSWTPTPEDFIAAATSPKERFKLLQQHNLRAHYSSSNRIQSRQYVSLTLPCLISAVKHGNKGQDGEHLLEYILKQPDYCKKSLSTLIIQDLMSATADHDAQYREHIEYILAQHQRRQEQEVEQERREDEQFWDESMSDVYDSD